MRNVVVLDRDERSQTRQLIEGLPTFRIDQLDGPLLDAVKTWSRQLPRRMIRLVEAFGSLSNAQGALLLRHLPIDGQLPPTPQDGEPSVEKSSRLSEYSLLLIMSLLADIIGYREEKKGRLVHDVCPVPGSETKQENTGSAYFELHTENAFHPFKPDFVGLLCLRADRERAARTLVASAQRAAARLSGADLRCLRQPLFRTRMPSSFGTGAGDQFARARPVLSGPTSDLRVCVDAFNTIGVSPEASRALTNFLAALRWTLAGWRLLPGDFVIVDNQHAVHARTAFTARYDGQDRWLQRVFALRQFTASASLRLPGSHVLGGAIAEAA